jgi:hypothetical protein
MADRYAAIQAGVVDNVIVADANFFIDNGVWAAQFDEIVQLNVDEACAPGWTRTQNGFEAPPLVVQSLEELSPALLDE